MCRSGILLLTCVVFCLSPLSAFSALINVPVDQPTIQAGVDAASDDDTVLVAPGTYSENIIIEEKCILLASNYIFSGDTLDIQSTIIGDYKKVEYKKCRNSASLTGFTIGYEAGGIEIDTSNVIISHSIIGSSYCIGTGSRRLTSIFYKIVKMTL